MSRPTAGLVQLTSGPDLGPNLAAAAEQVRAAASMGASVVLTPENTPILEPDHARLRSVVPGEADHPALTSFAELARDLDIWLLLGSTAVAVDGEDRLANRSYLFAPDGRIAARYDKIHMFDVDVPDGQTYRESATFRPGARAVVADTHWARLGLTICYDVRFPQLYRALGKAGASVITVPAAFTELTGRAHWHTLLRARAIETGAYVLAPAQCGEHAGGRRTYGHSLIVAPWGEIVAEGDTDPDVLTAELDLDAVAEARRRIPALTQDRDFTGPDVRA
ncbi:Predicted amidohydrolase [Limimonas halophila]|uniref:Predicted amidohydrolase n=1 Tax=Limimonas halophila TaxID=1082479 RepID=A0A1G7PXP4_9PROT|nr:carbon-nitrogen hydrolase family protein [Limimonas halophila]SDF91025.1 Predicted amidohydrolase [Limimonas halophila]